MRTIARLAALLIAVIIVMTPVVASACPTLVVSAPRTHRGSGGSDSFSVVSGGPANYSWEGMYPGTGKIWGRGTGSLNNGESTEIDYPDLSDWPVGEFGVREIHVTLHFTSFCGCYAGKDWDVFNHEPAPTPTIPPVPTEPIPVITPTVTSQLPTATVVITKTPTIVLPTSTTVITLTEETATPLIPTNTPAVPTVNPCTSGRVVNIDGKDVIICNEVTQYYPDIWVEATGDCTNVDGNTFAIFSVKLSPNAQIWRAYFVINGVAQPAFFEVPAHEETNLYLPNPLKVEFSSSVTSAHLHVDAAGYRAYKTDSADSNVVLDCKMPQPTPTTESTPVSTPEPEPTPSSGSAASVAYPNAGSTNGSPILWIGILVLCIGLGSGFPIIRRSLKKGK